MELQNSRIVNLYSELQEILEDDYDHAWNFNLAGARNKRTLEPLARDIQQEVTEIQKKYGDVNENGRFSFSDPQDAQDAQEEISLLENKTREVEIEKVDAEDVPNSLSGNQISGILEMIE